MCQLLLFLLFSGLFHLVLNWISFQYLNYLKTNLNIWFKELMIEDAHQNLLGSVTQDWSIIAPKFSVRDRFGNKVLCVEGPFFPCSFLNDVDFDVLSVNKAQKVGKITKKYSGLGMGRGMYTDSDYFGITFPIDLDVNIKAILLASTFLIVNFSLKFKKKV